MKQTAVEWLINTLFNESTVVVTQENNPILFDVLEQAKSMEKEQIMNARVEPLKLMQYLRDNHGYFGGPDNGSVIQREIDNSEQYYNETYGKDEDRR